MTQSAIGRSKIQYSHDVIQKRIKDLQKNTDFVATLFDGLIGYAIIAADFDGNIIAYNEGARHIYGYAPEEVIGKQNIEIFFPKDFIEAGELERSFKGLLSNGRFSYEGEKVRKNGESFLAKILFILAKDKAGQISGFVEMVEDLTEQKQAEEIAMQAMMNAERIKKLEQDLNTLEQLSGVHSTTVTARMFGLIPLREAGSEIFEGLVVKFINLLDLSLEQKMYKVEHNISESLRLMAEEMGYLKAGPKDVIDIYSAALRKKKNDKITSRKAMAYADEGKLMTIQLMGFLVSFYRKFS